MMCSKAAGQQFVVRCDNPASQHRVSLSTRSRGQSRITLNMCVEPDPTHLNQRLPGGQS